MFTRCLVAQFHESPAPTSFIPLPCILSIFIIPLPLLLTLLDLLIFLLPYYASFSSSSSVNSHVYTKTQTQIIETQANTHTCMSQSDTQSHMYGNTDRQTSRRYNQTHRLHLHGSVATLLPRRPPPLVTTCISIYANDDMNAYTAIFADKEKRTQRHSDGPRLPKKRLTGRVILGSRVWHFPLGFFDAYLTTLCRPECPVRLLFPCHCFESVYINTSVWSSMTDFGP